MKDLLHYFSKSDEKNAVDTELSQLHSIVEHARDNRKVGEQYMTLQDYVDCEIKRGIKEGSQANIRILVESLYELKIPDEQILEKLMQKYELTENEAKEYLK